MKLIKLLVVVVMGATLSGCALQEDWNQCRAGDAVACQRYAMWQQGMSDAADSINQQNAIAAQQAAANRPVITNCSSFGNSLSCTTY
ncbi:hypothetical protein DEV53_23315 [Salmonella enterica]|nr:hypothetical protein [Salmonella enterica]